MRGNVIPKPLRDPRLVLTNYFIANYILLVAICSNYLVVLDQLDAKTGLFAAALLLTYPLLYLLPSIGLSYLSGVGLSRLRIHRLSTLLRYILIIVATTLTVVIVVFDTRVHQLYGFHINAFVINLIITPGGIESLGGDLQSKLTVIAGVALLFVLEVALLLWMQPVRQPKQKYMKLALLFVALLSISERVSYGLADVSLHAGILNQSQMFPLYSELRIRSLAESFGIERPKRDHYALGDFDSRLKYPVHEIRASTRGKKFNVIWLVAESLRRDMLDSEIMPATSAFADRSLNFLNHYSGGNGTRQGMFSLFYGLHGSYWERFLSDNKGPVLIDELIKRGYAFGLYTGAAFTYPEFDRTIFARVPPQDLHQFSDNTPPEVRDRKNVESMIKDLHQRDRTKPFAGLIFFESTHARYFYEEEAKIRSSVLENMNYATMTKASLKSEIVGLKNRYINASRHVDNQIKRLLDALQMEGMMDNTIVVITGDHGEEFLENGHWGHNNGCSKHQISVPFVLHIPQESPRRIERTTSHTDLVATLLPRLGVTNDPSDYTVGTSLLGNLDHDFVVVSGSTGICYIDREYKFSIPTKNDSATLNRLTTAGDEPVENVLPFITSRKKYLTRAMAETRLFSE